MLDDLVGIEEAVKRTGLSDIYLRKLCRTNKVRARKFGMSWVIDPQSLDDYMKGERKRGRPPIDK